MDYALSCYDIFRFAASTLSLHFPNPCIEYLALPGTFGKPQIMLNMLCIISTKIKPVLSCIPYSGLLTVEYVKIYE